MYAVIIQDGEDYTKPELCFDFGGTDVSTFDSVEKAQELIEYFVEEGYSRENYFIVELKRI